MNWQNFKEIFDRKKELEIPRRKKSCREDKRPEWLSRDLLVK